MDNVQIDFINGTHGSFLMHVINNLANDTCVSPFVKYQAGSAHKIIPYKNKIATSGHYSIMNNKSTLRNVINIVMEDDDLLMVIELLMHRWNNFDPDKLDTNTFYKFNTSQYRTPLLRIYDRYMIEQKTDIPRHILRDYFKHTLDPVFYNDSLGESLCRLLIKQREMFDYSDLEGKYTEFKFKWFYNYTDFKQGIILIKDFFKLDIDINEDTLSKLHSQFLENNPAIGMNDVFKIFDQVKNNIEADIPKLKLLQESWLNLQIEKLTNKNMFTVDYFTNTKEIYEHLSKQEKYEI